MKVIAFVAAAALLAVAGFATPAAAQIDDAAILNFALNLEYLEAEFYQCAVTGKGLPANLRGGGPASTGCKKANLTDPLVQAYAAEIAADELAHVKFLRTALGAAAVPMPKLNIGSSFAAAAEAAFGMALPAAFSPYANDLFFLHGAFIFEDVGVTAYKGAAALINNSDYLTAAAGILAVEAYHAGVVRGALYEASNTTVAVYNVTVATIVDAIAALRSKLSGLNGTNADDFGVVAANGGSRFVPTDSNGIVYSRTPAQVVSIVTFGNANATGGFFPNGLNGVINATLTSADTPTVGNSTDTSSSAAAASAGTPTASGSASTTPTAAPTSQGASAVSVSALVAGAAAGAAALLMA